MLRGQGVRKIWLGSVLGPLRLTAPSTCLFPRQLIAVTASLAYLRCDRNPKEMNTVLNMLMCQRLHAQQHVQGCMHAMAWPPLFRYVLAHKSWHTAYMVQIRVLGLSSPVMLTIASGVSNDWSKCTGVLLLKQILS